MVRLQRSSENQYHTTIPLSKIEMLGWDGEKGKKLDVSTTPEKDGVIIREV
jgi:hypothetical protein